MKCKAKPTMHTMNGSKVNVTQTQKLLSFDNEKSREKKRTMNIK